MRGLPGSVVPVFGAMQPLGVISPCTAGGLAHLQERRDPGKRQEASGPSQDLFPAGE